VTEAEAEAVRAGFEAALTALWQGQTEDDDFNGLVLDAELTWRQVVVLRAYARYLRQVGIQFSQSYLQRVLRANPAITRLLVRLFESRFDPALAGRRRERCTAIAEELRSALDEVNSLDHDRILRAYLALIEATLRTNYYQYRPGGQPPVPPEARPMARTATGSGAWRRAISLRTWCSSSPPSRCPRCRRPGRSSRSSSTRPGWRRCTCGSARSPAAACAGRSGQKDFRTEVLGLVKAQEVKNSVIVPSGAKGGFVCKRLPDPADRDAYQAEVLACYRTFISAMLDVTDNIVGDAWYRRRGVVRLDGDDPYLVVAADKGTATFSDVANEIAGRYGYWLGDAFASGGSEGYDHKKMGITARGAWESVRWHFAALRLNPDTDDFTAVGIGDMSGDVFGNGMLLSRAHEAGRGVRPPARVRRPGPGPGGQLRRAAAAVRPAPLVLGGLRPALISAGGGVWPRSAKSVPISSRPARRSASTRRSPPLSPDELISAILRAPVDLLWNGGIGTYVKASYETHADAGDRSSDAVRVNATELRARVIGEGGNLGLTQAARIEYALAAAW
jgi:glutamate dehydrogenase